MLGEEENLAPRYAVEPCLEEGREHAHSLNYKRANYVNDNFVASSAAALFESGSAGASSERELGNMAKFEKDE